MATTLVALVDALDNIVIAADRARQDALIIMTCAKLTIALMTLGLVWFFALRLARWLVPLGAAAKIGIAIFGVARVGVLALELLSPLYYLSTALGVAAAAILFTPGARAWFLREKPAAEVFF